MTIIESGPTETRTGLRPTLDGWRLEWSPIVLGALTASAVSSILITFGTAVGLGVSSASPTWRDASFALWLLSGIFLVLTALVSFACGGYLAGRTRSAYAPAAAEDVERRDGWHGIGAWALAVVIGAIIAALVGLAANRPTALTTPPAAIRTFRFELRDRPSAPGAQAIAQRRARADTGGSGPDSSDVFEPRGVSADDRGYLIQIVSAATGLTGADAERRVDNAIADSRKAISNTRASTIILAFSLATSLLLGAVAAWAAAEAGGRHRDGMPLPAWMVAFEPVQSPQSRLAACRRRCPSDRGALASQLSGCGAARRNSIMLSIGRTAAVSGCSLH